MRSKSDALIFLASASNIVANIVIAVSATAISARLGLILWNTVTQYLSNTLTPHTCQCLATALLLTVLIDPHTIAIVSCWLRYPFTKKEGTDPVFPPQYKPTYAGIYWRTIFFIQQRSRELFCKFVVIFTLVRWFDANLPTNIVYFLRMVIGLYLLCVVVPYGLKLRPIICAVFREILLKLGETAVVIFRQYVALGHILGRNMMVVISMLFAYLAWTGILTSVLSKSGSAILSKGLLTASGKLMGVADVLFDMTDDGVVYKGVVVRCD